MKGPAKGAVPVGVGESLSHYLDFYFVLVFTIIYILAYPPPLILCVVLTYSGGGGYANEAFPSRSSHVRGAVQFTRIAAVFTCLSFYVLKQPFVRVRSILLRIIHTEAWYTR